MSMLKKRPFQIVIGFLLIIALILVYERYFNDIHTGNITQKLPYQAEWEVPPLTNNEQVLVDTILNQKFSYLGEGGQSYIFASEDQLYVLKLFKYKRFRPAWFVQLLPEQTFFSEFRERHITSRAKKLTTVFNGHQVAYDKNKEGSGLIFVQLNVSHIPKMVTLYDKLGLELQVDLGEAAYVLQKKGEMLRLVFPRLIESGQLALVKERIGQIFTMYLSEYSKGIYDDDHGVMQNFGFIGEQPFHLDVGKFKINEEFKNPEVYQEDLIKVAERMRLWFRKYYPEYYEEIVTDIENKLSVIIGKDYHFPNR
jgi:hypothetical protein